MVDDFGTLSESDDSSLILDTNNPVITCNKCNNKVPFTAEKEG